MIVKLLTEHHLEFVSLKGGCRGSSESTHVKMRYCWKSRVMAQITSHPSPPPSLSAGMMTFCLKKVDTLKTVINIGLTSQTSKTYNRSHTMRSKDPTKQTL